MQLFDQYEQNKTKKNMKNMSYNMYWVPHQATVMREKKYCKEKYNFLIVGKGGDRMEYEINGM